MKDDMDDLKSLWQSADPPEPPLGQAALLALIRQKTGGTWAKMRRALLSEIILAAVMLPLWAAYVAQRPPDSDLAYLAAVQCVLCSFIPLGYFYLASFRHLGRGIASDSRLVAALQRSVAYWEQALQFYFWGGVMMLPTFMLSMIWYQSASSGTCLADGPWLRTLGGIAIISALSALVVKFLIRVSYQKYLDQLKTCLRELEEI